MEKEQKKIETKEKRPLTEEQRLLRRKMLVFPLMGLTFLGCMWLIFAPLAGGQGEGTAGAGIQYRHAPAGRFQNHRRQGESL